MPVVGCGGRIGPHRPAMEFLCHSFHIKNDLDGGSPRSGHTRRLVVVLFGIGGQVGGVQGDNDMDLEATSTSTRKQLLSPYL